MQKIVKSNITNINSKQGRNLLRGIVGENKTTRIKRTLEKIQQCCTEQDYKRSIDVIRDSEIFKNNPVSRDFTKICPVDIGISIEFTPYEIIKKINNNKERLLLLIRIFHSAIDAIGRKDLHNALYYCDMAIESYGVSCFLLRIISFIRNHANENSAILKEIDRLNTKINSKNNKYLLLVIKELCSYKTDYFNICEKINNSESVYLNAIARNFIDPIPRSKSSFKTTFNAYYLFSLLDAYLFYSSIKRLEISFLIDGEGLDGSLVDCYEKLSKYTINLGSVDISS